ncbi:MAG TPA: metallophosphoesterase family protein [Terriglobales bacterium]|nr:metallophosphoesterase family protein [Terriglobales bacterium]
MRLLAHLSDLHFGRVDPVVLRALREELARIRPHLLVVSGDLTQRARLPEFQQARDFLDSVPGPQVVVPGNHDLSPFYSVARWRTPLARYMRTITADLQPFYGDEEVAVIGVNTARATTVKGGRINRLQVIRACERLSSAPPDAVRIIVTHHPFDLPLNGEGAVVGRARMAMAGFARCGVDLFLSGHLHVSHTGPTTTRYQISGYCALIVEAGTAVSSRVRGEFNSWNLLQIEPGRIGVPRFTWEGEHFNIAGIEHYGRGRGGWQPAAPRPSLPQAQLGSDG